MTILYFRFHQRRRQLNFEKSYRPKTWCCESVSFNVVQFETTFSWKTSNREYFCILNFLIFLKKFINPWKQIPTGVCGKKWQTLVSIDIYEYTPNPVTTLKLTLLKRQRLLNAWMQTDLFYYVLLNWTFSIG